MHKAELETRLLNDRVLVSRLPVFEAKPVSGAPILKRLLLPQGELAHFWDGEESIHYMAFLELRAGTIRGNHYHRHKRELIYIISGEVRLLVEDIESGTREEITLVDGDLARIDTGVAHVYRITNPGQAIEFSSARFNPSDLFPWALIDTLPKQSG